MILKFQGPSKEAVIVLLTTCGICFLKSENHRSYAFQFKKSLPFLYFPCLSLSAMCKELLALEREEATSSFLMTCQGHILRQGDLPGGPGEGSYRTFCQTVLSAVSSLISVLDRGWCFSFLFSASLFALSLEREFSYGRKCSRVDQIIVLVTFVPGQQRKCQPDPFSRTELAVHFREGLGGSPAGGKLERLCEHFLRSRSMSGHTWFWFLGIRQNNTGWHFPRGFTLGSYGGGPWLTFLFY